MLCITLLLVIRVATHLTPHDGAVTAVALPLQQAMATLPPSNTVSMASTGTGTIPPLAGQDKGRASSDSLALLEAYLIPAASAAGNQSGRAPDSSSLPVDDKTLTTLRSYKASLDQRTDELDQRENNLKKAEEKLQQRVTELEQLEASIQQRLQDEAGIKTKKIKRLTSVYEGMKAEKAAPVIAEMELATVVKIFSLMDEKKVGKILSFLPADKAVQISQALTRQISTVK